ncbi:MAG: hypothetical protein ACLSX5_13590 [Lachnospiraceae bacterium]
MIKFIRTAMIAALFTLSAAVTVFAEESIKSIQISLDIPGTIDSGSPIGGVSASTDSKEYTVDNAQFLNGGDIWLGGTTPQIQVDLIAEEGYKFPNTISKKNVTITSNQSEPTFSKGKRDSNDETYFSVYINLPRIPGSLYDSQSMYWDGCTASWTIVDNADRYEVRLYRGSNLVTTVKTDSDFYDFTGRMTTKGYYRFRVRPIMDDQYLGSWSSYSEDIYIDSDEAKENRDYADFEDDHSDYYSKGPGSMGHYNPNYPGITPTNGNAWVSTSQGWRYRFGNGDYAYNGWQLINGKYYFFNNAGYMMTGWLFLDNGWYYLNPDGAMTTGWQLVNDKWYYMAGNGLMQTGWLNLDNRWYYLNLDGAMVTGWNYINGFWYYMDVSGAMWSNGWYNIDGKTYYLYGDGKMAANIRTADGHYVDASGALVW